MRAFLFVAVGGALGAMLRHGASRGAIAWLGEGFPIATLLVNVVGSFALGGLYALSGRGALSPDLQLLLGTGLCGALTTFSTYSVESLTLIHEGQVGWAIANVVLNVVLGMGAAALAMALLQGPLSAS